VEGRGAGYRGAMVVYVILLLVLAGGVMVVAAFFDRWRGRRVEEDLQPAREQEGRHRSE
jgi:hypothetical protein